MEQTLYHIDQILKHGTNLACTRNNNTGLRNKWRLHGNKNLVSGTSHGCNDGTQIYRRWNKS
jgi:hypothetical protein